MVSLAGGCGAGCCNHSYKVVVLGSIPSSRTKHVTAFTSNRLYTHNQTTYTKHAKGGETHQCYKTLRNTLHSANTEANTTTESTAYTCRKTADSGATNSKENSLKHTAAGCKTKTNKTKKGDPSTKPGSPFPFTPTKGQPAPPRTAHTAKPPGPTNPQQPAGASPPNNPQWCPYRSLVPHSKQISAHGYD